MNRKGDDDRSERKSIIVEEEAERLEIEENTGHDDKEEKFLNHATANSEDADEKPAKILQYQPKQGFGRYKNATSNLVPIRFKKKTEDTEIVDNAGLCSFVLFGWVSKFMYSGLGKGFDAEKWPALSPYDKSDLSADRLEILWNAELKEQGPENASFGKAVWRFMRTRAIIANTMFGLSIICGFVSQTLLMRKLIEHVESSDGTLEDGLKWVGLLVFGETIRLFLFAWSWAMSYRTSVRAKLACMVVLYRKIIRLNHLGDTSTGEITNLFSNDCQRILDMVMYTPSVIGGPIMGVFGVCYILVLLGPMALLGILVFVMFLPIQFRLSRLTGRLRAQAVTFSDARIRLTNEILDTIKLIKMYAWERSFRDDLMGIRRDEQNLIFKTNYTQSVGIALSPTVPVISAIITFISHLSTGQNLTAAQAFPISAFFGSQMTQTLLRSREGVQAFIDSTVAFARIKRVLLLKEESCEVSKPIIKSQAVSISHGTFAYNAFSNQIDERSEPQDEQGKNIRESSGNESEKTKLRADPETQTVQVLCDINFEATKGKLIGICGQVGSGKSSLLLAALGQLRATEGQVMRDGSCAYVSQQAWIVNATLRDNILFGARFNSTRYHYALDVCNLYYDLKTMPGGDQTEIGERGINLSGGQKQRIALARALYADRDIYLLDDPLSAVDAHVGLHIFDHLITGALKSKTVLFVTHQIQYLNRCDGVYMMRDGRIVEHGTHDELMKFDREYALMVNSISCGNETTNVTTDNQNSQNCAYLSAVASTGSNHSSSDTAAAGDKKEPLSAPQTALTQAEKSEEGSVKARTYLSYVNAAGGMLSAVIVFALTLLSVGSSSFSTWWLAKWIGAGGGNITDPVTNETIVSDNMNDNPNFLFYELIYGASIVVILLTNVIRGYVFCRATIKASDTIYSSLLSRVITSPMRFFDMTPTGRIQNLFSKDMDDVDNKLPFSIDVIIQNLLLVFAAIFLISVVFPWFIIPMCFLAGLYYICGKIYRISSRGLKRAESVSRAPILSYVTATIQGLSTIHAFEKDLDFKANFSKLANNSSRYGYMGLAASRWLAVRIEMIAILTTCVTAVMVVMTKGEISPALAGLALAYSVYIASIFQFTIRILSETESQFISVERLNGYINRRETDGWNGRTLFRVEPNWPTEGVIRFRKVMMSYDKDSSLVLNGVDFTVNPHEKIGIVGRTGSGKSSLTVALFRLVELSGGMITIDNIDIAELTLRDLRSRVSIIPQDPILFSGTIRSNLDPFKAYSDTEIWEALEKTQLKDRVRSIPGQLEAKVGFEGDNLSVGERQLLCLARAVLKRSKILILDEATASVDPETEIAVQNTINQEFVESTVLTIAHRLQTVLSCDRILLMENGQVAEFDAPSTLLADSTSKFSKMMAAAEQAQQR